MPRITPLLLVAACAACGTLPPQGRTPFTPTPATLAVLSELERLHPAPPASLPPRLARDNPTLADAARALPNSHGLPFSSTEVAVVQELVASGAEGPLPARLYRPERTKDTPIIVYFPGGTWVTGTLDDADESARQLSARTGFIVLAIRTRQAPEAKFPAAHDDALAAYRWARTAMRSWGADPTRVVLAGEGPGADLALSTAYRSRELVAATPDHLLLITPQITTALRDDSMSDSGRSRPLTRRTVSAAQYDYVARNRELDDPRLDLLPRTDTAQIPPTTIILAEIDPLRSQGEALAAQLKAQGIKANARLFPGTTHGFFGLGSTLPEAAAAEDYAATQLKAALPAPKRRR